MVDNATAESGTIRQQRLAAGLSQEQLARAADCSTAYVRVIERGYQPRHPGAVFERVLAVLERISTSEARPHTGLREDTAGHRRDGSG